jgi:mono/diheme cytochrome c family protein
MKRAFLFTLLFLSSGIVAARAEVLDYKKEVLDIMKKNCWDCHSNETEVKGNVDLDPATLADQIGPYNIIRPGNPGESGFVERLKLDETHADFMPRKGSPLAAREIETIEAWIAAGAIIDAEKMTPDEEKRAAEAKPAVADMKSGGTDGEYLEWTNAAGKVIEARMVSLDTDSVKLLLKSGRAYEVSLKDLSPESVDQARKLGGQ